jgi:exodeoxyribonuclease III
MTYNILDGGHTREHEIVEVIRTASPNVVVLQEVIDEDALRSMAHHLQMKDFLADGNRDRRVALLSQLPIENFKSCHPVFPIWHNFIEATIRAPSGEVFRLIGVHLVANPWIVFEFWRLLEILYILRHIRQYSNEPCLMAGDFNSVAPGDRVIRSTMPIRLKFILWSQGNRVYRFALQTLLSSEFIDCFRLKNSTDDGFTLPPPAPTIRLDYGFINPAMEKYVKNCWVVREPHNVTKASDHYPVMVELNFENKEGNGNLK